MATISNAMDTFDMTVDAFVKEAEGMRDLEAERQADRSAEAAKQAEAKLGLAVMERPSN